MSYILNIYKYPRRIIAAVGGAVTYYIKVNSTSSDVLLANNTGDKLVWTI